MEENSLKEAMEAVKSSYHTSFYGTGIGTLGEKAVHATLKYYFEPDPACHEVKCLGYVADVLRDDHIYEIQSKQWYRLQKKLEVFLKEYQVTVVYPVITRKEICWVDPETGEEVERRISPKHIGVEHALYELYGIKEFLLHPGLDVRLVLLETQEIKLLDGFGKGKKYHATKYDHIPQKLTGVVTLKELEDYQIFLPELEEFSAKEYGEDRHIPLDHARRSVNVLTHLGLIQQIGSEGKAYRYGIVKR